MNTQNKEVFELSRKLHVAIRLLPASKATVKNLRVRLLEFLPLEQNRWMYRLHEICVDAMLDESIDDDLREVIMLGLQQLCLQVGGYKK